MKAIIFILINLFISTQSQQCKFNIYKYEDSAKPPLLIDPVQKSIKYPDKEGNIVINENESIGLMCGSFSSFLGSYVTLECKSGTTFFYGSQRNKFDIFDITCNSYAEPITRVISGCMRSAQLVEVFFPIENTKIPLYTSCYEPSTCQVHYVSYTIKPHENQKSKTLSFNFRINNLIKCDVINLYTREEERRTFLKIFPKQDQNYIQDQYLAKG